MITLTVIFDSNSSVFCQHGKIYLWSRWSTKTT